MDLPDLLKTKRVHASEGAWLQGPLQEGSTGRNGPGLAASALRRAGLRAGAAVPWCAHRRGRERVGAGGRSHTSYMF